MSSYQIQRWLDLGFSKDVRGWLGVGLDGDVDLCQNCRRLPSGAWHLDDPTKPGTVVSALGGNIALYHLTAGANPRTLVPIMTVLSSGAVSAAGGLHDRGRTTAIGEWINVPFDANSFGSSGGSGGWGAGYWQVDAADIATLAYTLIGKTMVLNCYIQATNVPIVAGVLYVVLPPGFVAAQHARAIIQAVNAGINNEGMLVATAGSNVLSLYATTTGTAWTATAGHNTYCIGQITIPVDF
jgi:hypothetical protein